MRWSTRLFWAALLTGAVLRVLVARSVGGRLDSDQAVVYLMARHGGGGLMFWGQSYGGTLLQLSAAAFFKVLGASVPVLQLVEALWWLATALQLRALATRLWGAFAGDLAGALLWLPGPALLWLTVRDPGFYGTTLALGAGALLLALDDRPLSAIRGLPLGLAAGLAVWTSPIGIAFAAPTLAYTLLRRKATVVGHLSVVAGTALGALPLLLARMTADSMSPPALRTPSGQVPHRAAEIVFQLLPYTWVGDSPRERAVVGFLWVALVLGGAVLAVETRAWKVLVLSAVSVLGVVVIGVSTALLIPSSLRYGALLAPVPFVLLAGAVAALGRARWAGWVLVLVLAGWTVQVSDAATGGFRPAGANHWEGEGGDLRRTGSGYARADALDVPLLVGHLRSLGVHAVFADYWVAYLIAAESGEQVTADPLTQSRYLPYQQRARAAANTVLVVLTGRENDRQVRADTRLPAYTSTQVAEFTVFAFAGRVPWDQLPRGLY